MLDCLADDVIHDINQGGRQVGKEAFRKFLAEMNEFYDENLTDIQIMLNRNGDRAAAEFICNGIL